MPAEITMPQLSDTMTEGTMVKWHKKEGDKISDGEVVGEVETDKATMDLEAFEGGVLAHIAAKEGEKVKVGELIAVVAVSGEDPAEIKKQYASGASRTAKPEVVHASVSTPKATSPDEAPKPSAPTPAEEPPPSPVERHAGNGDRVRVSPLAKRLAQEHGVDLSQVRGSGPGGRIVQKDVLAAAGAAPSTSVAPSQPVPGASTKTVAGPQLPSRVASGKSQSIELSKMRQTIALRLQQSKQQIPHFYETIDIDMEAAAALRDKLNKQLEKQQIRLSISDLVNKAIASALVEHPELNAHYDAANNRIVRYGDVHLGIAVALPEGLIVPVLRNIDQMGLREIRVRSVDLVERARSQKLKKDEMSGATFTVSTLGALGIREFSAIINPPEVAILAVGAVEKRPVVREDQIVPRTMMTVTLSVDHRAVDGAGAAEFLRTLKFLLEEPGMMLA